ncbi:MAG TPA: hypothetical protein DCM87_17940 [Planctomycetes bacterium]|jgi:hypothetical protein|nr:hypothetical protein [Planctomycetota bacterium]
MRCRIAVLGALAAGVCGCASYDEIIAPARAAYAIGDYAEAERVLAPYAEEDGKDRPAFLCERALPQLAQGKLRDATEGLRAARDQFDRHEQKLATEWIGSLLVDDTVIAYPGEDYEKILIRVVLALADLLGARKDAAAYANQVILKRQEIIDRSPEVDGNKIKASYKDLGIGRYLVGLLAEEAFNQGEARRNYRELVALEPAFAYGPEDLERAETRAPSERGNGVLYVFCFVDRGPFKVQVEHEPSTMAMHMVWIMGSLIGQKLVTPSIVPVKVPGLFFPERTIEDVEVASAAGPARPTSELLSVQDAAGQQFDIVRDWIVAKAFLRRLVKKAVVETGKRVVQHQQKGDKRRMSDAQVATEVGAFLVGAIWEAIESADTRCWSLLPASIQAVRLELPEGEHAIRLTPRWRGHAAGRPVEAPVIIEDGRNAYCLAIFPTSRAAPAVIVSQPLFASQAQ